MGDRVQVSIHSRTEVREILFHLFPSRLLLAGFNPLPDRSPGDTPNWRRWERSRDRFNPLPDRSPGDTAYPGRRRLNDGVSIHSRTEVREIRRSSMTMPTASRRFNPLPDRSPGDTPPFQLTKLKGNFSFTARTLAQKSTITQSVAWPLCHFRQIYLHVQLSRTSLAFDPHFRFACDFPHLVKNNNTHSNNQCL